MNTLALLALIDVALQLVERIPPALDALKRSEELTPEMEAALDERIAKLKDKAHWQV